MNINVYQADVSRIGGSIATILSFADLFKELGHNVRILTSWHERFEKSLIGDKKDLISFYSFKNLTLEDFDFSWSWDKIKNRKNRPPADIDFTRGLSCSRYMKNKGILWCIVPIEIKSLSHPNIIQTWTNSETIKKKLFPLKPEIVYPPHDYYLFRKYSKNWKYRKYDFVSILRSNEWFNKGIDLYEYLAKNSGLKSILITTANSSSLKKKIGSLGIDYRINISREECARILGNSKVLFHPSRVESCPLVIYEGLNSGCIPVTRDVGAVREQLDGKGIIWERDNQALRNILKGLDRNNIEERIQRGMFFDRENVKKIVKEKLKEV